MAQSDFRSGGRLASACADAQPAANISGGLQARQLCRAAVADFVLGAPRGSVIAVGGIDGENLRGLLDEVEPTEDDRIALFVLMRPAASVEAYVEQVIAVLAETATSLWPVWLNDVSFAMCRDDTLGHQAVAVIAKEAAARSSDISPNWLEAAAGLVLRGLPPRVVGALPAVEVAQLSRAIAWAGLVIVTDVTAAADTSSTAALAHALEWIAQHSRAGVVALFADLPRLDSPFDRILYGARRVVTEGELGKTGFRAEVCEDDGGENWLAPWRGSPHPLSRIEQRLGAMLRDDTELAGLFYFNRSIETVRGSRPKVDLVWIDGRLVIELDGYSDHSTRRAFIGDRHRDYELALSGYTVLRLANDEVMQDFGRAIEKIRDLVRLRRSQMNGG